jgi:hypothetical protein
MPYPNGQPMPHEVPQAPGASVAAPQAPVIMFPPRPEVSKTSGYHGPSTVTSVKQASPETERQLTAVETGAADEVEALQRKTEAQNQVTETQALGDDVLAANQRYYATIRENEAARRNEQIEAAMATEAQKRQEMEATGKPTSYWADQSAPAKVLSAFLVGLGQYAAGPGGRNPALEILNDAMARDRQLKIDQFTRSKEFFQLATQDREAAMAARDKRLKEIDDEQIVQSNILQKQIDAVAKRAGKPVALAAADELRAKREVEIADKLAGRRQNYDAEITKNSGYKSGSTTVNSGGPADAPKPPGFAERGAATTAAASAENMEKLATLIEKNPKAWAEYQAALRDDQKASAADSNILMKGIRGAGQIAGYVPTALEQRLKSSEAREINSLLAPLQTAKARELDPVGAINADVMKAARDHLNLTSAKPSEIAAEARKFRDRAMGQQSAAIPGGAPAPAPAANDNAPAAKPDRKAMTGEAAAAANWLRANPNHPKAAGVRARLKAMAQ